MAEMLWFIGGMALMMALYLFSMLLDALYQRLLRKSSRHQTRSVRLGIHNPGIDPKDVGSQAATGVEDGVM